jgi:hypothetical protein
MRGIHFPAAEARHGRMDGPNKSGHDGLREPFTRPYSRVIPRFMRGIHFPAAEARHGRMDGPTKSGHDECG